MTATLALPPGMRLGHATDDEAGSGGLTGAAAGRSFLWSCMKIGGDACGVAFVATAETLSLDGLEGGSTYEFQVQARADNRSSTASVSLDVVGVGEGPDLLVRQPQR